MTDGPGVSELLNFIEIGSPIQPKDLHKVTPRFLSERVPRSHDACQFMPLPNGFVTTGVFLPLRASQPFQTCLGLCELSVRTDQVVAIRGLPQKGPDLRLPGFC